MEYGQWGRCLAEDGHEGACKMPTEADWRSLHALTLPSEV
jgi:hypothetical protein